MGSDDSRRRKNPAEDRNAGFRRAAAIGVLAAILFVAGRLMDIHPLAVFRAVTGDESGPTGAAASAAPKSGEIDHQTAFVRAVLAETTAVWGAYFQRLGRRYVEPDLVLYSGRVAAACGAAQAAAGPFYCPRTRRLYVDLAFFHQLATDYGAAGAFGQIYVIAHEVGHHVQNLLGITGPAAGMELQADCFAGVWAARANAAHPVLGVGDALQGLQAAAAVGNDTLQRRDRSTAVPDSFTQVAAAARMRWFRRGFDAAAIGACDTFQPGAVP
ncbi:MAG: neutral zinc metallopeptidase [Gammaproteobacteria bacterium]|nr:neutral zinc metallopeptidase [Gammaproteobacteria bacterium]